MRTKKEATTRPENEDGAHPSDTNEMCLLIESETDILISPEGAFWCGSLDSSTVQYLQYYGSGVQ